MITLVEAESEREYEEWREKEDMEYRRLMDVGMSICENRITEHGFTMVYSDDKKEEEDETESHQMEERRTTIMGVMERLEKENNILREEKAGMAQQHRIEIDELNDKIALMDLHKEELREKMEAKYHREGEKIKGIEESKREMGKMKMKMIDLEIKAQADDELIKSIQQALLEKSRESRATINAYEKEKMKCEILQEEINEITTMAKNMTETTKRTNRMKQLSNERLLNAYKEPTTLRRASSIISTSTDKSRETNKRMDKMIMTMSANDDVMTKGRRFLDTPTESITWEQAEKKAKQIKWPTFEGTMTSETNLRLFIIQIESARERMIPDDVIKDSIIQHLMSSKYMAQFANLTQELSPRTLENVIKILERLNPEEQCMSADERFKAIKMAGDESAISYVRRLQTAYRDIFGSATLGETRRVRAQFIKGYTNDGIKLDREERKNLYLCNDLIDLAIGADKAMQRQKKEKEKKAEKKKTAKTPTPPLQKPSDQSKENTPEQRFQDIFEKQNQSSSHMRVSPTGNQWRTSPGLYAKRATLAEVVDGKSLNGTPVCQSCAQEGHNYNQCKYWEYCKLCCGEFRHNSIWHLKKQNRDKIEYGNQNCQTTMPPTKANNINYRSELQNKE